MLSRTSYVFKLQDKHNASSQYMYGASELYPNTKLRNFLEFNIIH